MGSTWMSSVGVDSRMENGLRLLEKINNAMEHVLAGVGRKGFGHIVPAPASRSQTRETFPGGNGMDHGK